MYIKKNLHLYATNSTIHDHKTRSRLCIHLTRMNKAKTQKSLIYLGKKLYNKLPQEIKDINDHHTFSQRLKLYLLMNCYYTIDEYLK